MEQLGCLFACLGSRYSEGSSSGFGLEIGSFIVSRLDVGIRLVGVAGANGVAGAFERKVTVMKAV